MEDEDKTLKEQKERPCQLKAMTVRVMADFSTAETQAKGPSNNI